jgi:hypothetical protein
MGYAQALADGAQQRYIAACDDAARKCATATAADFGNREALAPAVAAVEHREAVFADLMRTEGWYCAHVICEPEAG